MDENAPERKRLAQPDNSRRMSLPRLSGSKLQEIFKYPGKQLKNAITKRKRAQNQEDAVSISSLEFPPEDEPKKKRQSISILSPAQSIKSVTSAMKRSASNLSLRSIKDATTPSKKQITTPYRKPAPATPQRRESLFWYQTMSEVDLARFDDTERKRQEAIFELYSGEKDLVKDLQMLRDIYYMPMKMLAILSDADADSIFGNIDRLTSIHEDLVEKLEKFRQPDNTIQCVGKLLMEWAPQLEKYSAYCANQVEAKALLDTKRQERAVDDFLQRCQESAFSRKLDLWSFLDVPRSRLVKYPLMLQAIAKHTPSSHSDNAELPEVMEMMEDIIRDVNEKQGMARCDFIKSRLSYGCESQKSELIDTSSYIVCDGMLRNARNTKLHVLLFNKVLVLTRPAQRESGVRYEVHHTPIPLDDLYLEPEIDGRSGSFRSTFSTAAQNGKEKCYFRVSSGMGGTEYTLSTNDKHDKQQWITSISDVIDPTHMGPPPFRSASRKNRFIRSRLEGHNTSRVSICSATTASSSEYSGVQRQGSSASDHGVHYGAYLDESPIVPTKSQRVSDAIEEAASPFGSVHGINLSDEEFDGEIQEDNSSDSSEDISFDPVRARKIASPLWEEDEDERDAGDEPQRSTPAGSTGN